MPPEECARCGSLEELPENSDVCEDCMSAIPAGTEFAEMFAPQNAEQQDVPDHVKRRENKREHERRQAVREHNRQQRNGEIFKGSDK